MLRVSKRFCERNKLIGFLACTSLYTYHALGRVFHISAERVRQIKQKYIRQCRWYRIGPLVNCPACIKPVIFT
jgi:hypothetical protein